MRTCVSNNQPEPWQTDPLVSMTPLGAERPVGIDHCIAPTVQHLWDHGINTLGSCCGHGDANPSVVLDGQALPAAAETAFARARAAIREVDDREWDLLAWVLTKARPDATSKPEGGEG